MTIIKTPTIVRQAVQPHTDVNGRDCVRTAQVIDLGVGGPFVFQTYDVYANGRTTLDHSEAWRTHDGVMSAWREKGWDCPAEPYSIAPARGCGRLDEAWNVLKNGKYHCRATSRDHAEELAGRKNREFAQTSRWIQQLA